MQSGAAVQKASRSQAGPGLEARTGPARPDGLAAAQRPQPCDVRGALSGLDVGCCAQTAGPPTAPRGSTLMAVRFQLVIDCRDPEPLARFWAAALGYEFESPPEGFAAWDDYWLDVGVGEEDLGIG